MCRNRTWHVKYLKTASTRDGDGGVIYDIKEAGEVGDLVQDVHIYLTEHRYLLGCTEPCMWTIQSKAVKFSIHDGELFFKKKRKHGMAKERILLLDYLFQIANSRSRWRSSDHVHTDPMFCRPLGCEDMEQFMWPGIVKDVKEMVCFPHCNVVQGWCNLFIKTCDACHRVNCHCRPLLSSIQCQLVETPWYHVGIDFIGPINMTVSGNCYTLTPSDYCSKWVEAVSTPSKCASGVANALFKVYTYFTFSQCVYSQCSCIFCIWHHWLVAYTFLRFSSTWVCHVCWPVTKERSLSIRWTTI